jgi:hypothetical protein
MLCTHCLVPFPVLHLRREFFRLLLGSWIGVVAHFSACLFRDSRLVAPGGRGHQLGPVIDQDRRGQEATAEAVAAAAYIGLPLQRFLLQLDQALRQEHYC